MAPSDSVGFVREDDPGACQNHISQSLTVTLHLQPGSEARGQAKNKHFIRTSNIMDNELGVTKPLKGLKE